MDCLFCFGGFLTFISSKYILDSGAVSHSLNPSDSIGSTPPFLDGLVWRWLLAVGGQLSAISGQGSARLCMVFYKLKGGRLSAVGGRLSAVSGQGLARLCMVFYKLYTISYIL